MSKYFLLALGLLLVVFATVTKADTLYVGWQSGGAVDAYDFGYWRLLVDRG